MNELLAVTEVTQAHVYKGEHLAAKLERTAHGSRLIYDTSYLKRIDTESSQCWVAWNLPARREPYETRGYNLHPFFAGLLPEGLRLQALITNIKTSPDDLFSLLVATGEDCAGDISITVPNAPESKKATGALATLDFSHLFMQSISGSRADVNFSLAGIQEKVSSNMISFPLKLARKKKQYILKIANKRFPQIIQNEHFFMVFASACGLRVAHTAIVYDKHRTPGLLIERFDREYQTPTRTSVKFHQEDACQLLNLYPADKYRVGFNKIAEVMQKFATSATVVLVELMKLQAFSYIIGNGDLHAKNISLIERDGLIQLSPAYDVLSTLPYGDRSMALEFEGRKDNLTLTDFLAFAKRYHLSEKVVKGMLEELVEQTESLGDTELDEIGLPQKKRSHLLKTIQKRRSDLLTNK